MGALERATRSAPKRSKMERAPAPAPAPAPAAAPAGARSAPWERSMEALHGARSLWGSTLQNLGRRLRRPLPRSARRGSAPRYVGASALPNLAGSLGALPVRERPPAEGTLHPRVPVQQPPRGVANSPLTTPHSPLPTPHSPLPIPQSPRFWSETPRRNLSIRSKSEFIPNSTVEFVPNSDFHRGFWERSPVPGSPPPDPRSVPNTPIPPSAPRTASAWCSLALKNPTTRPPGHPATTPPGHDATRPQRRTATRRHGDTAT